MYEMRILYYTQQSMVSWSDLDPTNWGERPRGMSQSHWRKTCRARRDHGVIYESP